MSREAIAKIREAEARAEVIRAEAAETARRRIEKNEKDCSAEARRVTDTTAAELRTKLDEVRARAEILIEQSREEAAADLEALEADAHAGMRDAVKLIVWEMHDLCQ